MMRDSVNHDMRVAPSIRISATRLMLWRQRIADARKAKGWTQQQLAEAIGVSQSTVAGYEKGPNEPTLSMIEKIAAVLGTTPEHLCFGIQAPLDGEEHPIQSVDRELLQRIIVTLEKSLARDRAQMAPESKARIIFAIHDLASELPDWGKLAAELDRLIVTAKKR